MEMKKFTKMEISSIKRTAQNVNSFVIKMNKLQEVIHRAQEEYDALEQQQNMWEAPIEAMTGGYKTTDLVNKFIKVTGKDKEGKDIKVTSYVLKYPDTIIPPKMEGIEYIQQEVDGEIITKLADDIDDTENAPETEYAAGEESPFNPTTL